MLYEVTFLVQCGPLTQVSGMKIASTMFQRMSLGASCPIQAGIKSGRGKFVYDPNFRKAVQLRPIFKFQSDNGPLVLKQLPQGHAEAELNQRLAHACPNSRHLLIGQVYEGDTMVEEALKGALSRTDNTDLQKALHRIDFSNNNYLVMPEAGLDVRSWKAQRKGSISRQEKYLVCQNTFNGICELHDAGIGHKDIHDGQVIVYDSDVKLFDFGMSQNKNATVRISAGGFPPRKIDIATWRYDFMRFAEWFLTWLDAENFKIRGPRDFRKFFRNEKNSEEGCRRYIQEALDRYA